MPILRLLVIILVIVNLVLLSMGLGYISSGPEGEGDRLVRQIAADKVKIVKESAAQPSASAAEPTAPPPIAATPTPVTPPKAPADKPASTPAEKPTEKPAAKPVEKPAAKPAPPAEPTSKPAPKVAEVCKVVPTMPRALAERAAAIIHGMAGVALEEKDVPAPETRYWVLLPAQKSREAAEARVEELKSKGVKNHFIVQEEGANRNAVSLDIFRLEAGAKECLADAQRKGFSDAILTTRGGEAKRDLILRGPATAVDGAIARLNHDLGKLRTATCGAR